MSARRRGRYIRDGTGRDDEDGEEREPAGRRGVDAGGREPRDEATAAASSIPPSSASASDQAASGRTRARADTPGQLPTVGA